MITLAPELQGATEMIRTGIANGWVMAAGHTNASTAEIAEAADAGCRYVTHLFNAMTPIHHRSPGAAVGALLDDRLTVGLIADGVHVDDAMIDLAWRLAGPKRLNLVSDAVAAMGLPNGSDLQLGDRRVRVIDGTVRTTDGALAGSAGLLIDAVRRLRAVTAATVPDALATVTSVPAKLLGDTTRGRIAVGCRADLVVLNDELEIDSVFVAGRRHYP
jgi:N-acetylglucosamine-6-phosphate deacetylase